ADVRRDVGGHPGRRSGISRRARVHGWRHRREALLEAGHRRLRLLAAATATGVRLSRAVPRCRRASAGGGAAVRRPRARPGPDGGRGRMRVSELTRPPRLRPGDRVAVVSPSGPVSEDRLDAGCAILRGWGLDVVLGKHVTDVHDRFGYLAGDD